MVSIRLNAIPLRQQVLDGIRRAIIDGELAPGERLRENDLSVSSGVSRTVIREVLRQLETEGLVFAARNKGAIVRTPTQKEAKDIYGIRGVLEGMAARLFTNNASAEQVGRLSRELKLVEDAYQSGDVKRVLESKDRFYDVLFEGADSEVLCSILKTLNARISRWRALGLMHPKRLPSRSASTIRELRAMLRAVRARDAAAAEEIAKKHVENNAAALMALLDHERIDQVA